MLRRPLGQKQDLNLYYEQYLYGTDVNLLSYLWISKDTNNMNRWINRLDKDYTLQIQLQQGDLYFKVEHLSTQMAKCRSLQHICKHVRCLLIPNSKSPISRWQNGLANLLLLILPLLLQMVLVLSISKLLFSFENHISPYFYFPLSPRKGKFLQNHFRHGSMFQLSSIQLWFLV